MQPALRIARFTIPRKMILGSATERSSVAALFAEYEMVVLRAELLAAEDAFDYIATSPKFTEVPHGGCTPMVRFMLHRDAAGMFFANGHEYVR